MVAAINVSKTAVRCLAILTVSYSLSAMAQTTVSPQIQLTARLTTTISIDPATPDTSIEEKCRIYRAVSIAWNDADSLAAGVAIGSSKDGCTYDGQVNIYKIHSTTGRASLQHSLTDATDNVLTIAYNHDYSRLAIGDADGNIEVYNGKTPADPISLVSSGTIRRIWTLAYSPDGSQLAAGSGDHKVRIFSGTAPTTPQLPVLEDAEDRVRTLAFSPSGSHLAVSGSDSKVRIYRLDPSEAVLEATLTDSNDVIWSLTYNPDGSRLAVGGRDEIVWIYDGRNPGSPLQTLSGVSKWVTGVAYSPDGNILAVGSRDGRVRLYDGKHPLRPVRILSVAGSRGSSPTSADPWVQLAFNHDGSRLAATGYEGKILIFNIQQIMSTTVSTIDTDAAELPTTDRTATRATTQAATTNSTTPHGSNSASAPEVTISLLLMAVLNAAYF